MPVVPQRAAARTMSAPPPNRRTGVVEPMDILVKENAPELEPEGSSNPGRAAVVRTASETTPGMAAGRGKGDPGQERGGPS
ncbi:hypothetical protein GCM10027176_05520 [Actinoallomurus bryophytorum]